MSDSANEENIEMANEYTKDEVRDSGNMGDYESSDEQEELCAQDEGKVSQQNLFTVINNPQIFELFIIRIACLLLVSIWFPFTLVGKFKEVEFKLEN